MSDETSDRPATFREVFGEPEYRALYAATTLSWVGDYIARAAITVIVFKQTGSVGWSAAAFAVSYLPWLLGGPLLSTVAERYPYRRVMITCDLVRMGLIALVAIPHLPVGVMLLLVFLTTLANPPSQAARSALLPLILPGDRVVLGLSINQSTGQAAQVVGYAAGAGLAAVSPRGAILLDALTFLASALIIRFGVRARPSAMTPATRSSLVSEMAEGFRLVFGHSVLRSIAVIVFSITLFAIVPEGLAAAWVADYTDQKEPNGLYLAVIMAASPVGLVLGSILMARLVRPALRTRLVRPFAILSPLVLVPALLNPHPYVIAVLAGISGFAVAGLMPVANGLFVQALPHGYRARAFGVMATGVQICQGGAVLLTGLLAQKFDIPPVVGLWSLAGVVLMVVVSATWPSPRRFEEAIAAAEETRPEPPARPAAPSQRGAPAPSPNGSAPERGAPAEPGRHRPAHVPPRLSRPRPGRPRP